VWRLPNAGRSRESERGVSDGSLEGRAVHAARNLRHFRSDREAARVRRRRGCEVRLCSGRVPFERPVASAPRSGATGCAEHSGRPRQVVARWNGASSAGPRASVRPIVCRGSVRSASGTGTTAALRIRTLRALDSPSADPTRSRSQGAQEPQMAPPGGFTRAPHKLQKGPPQIAIGGKLHGRSTWESGRPGGTRAARVPSQGLIEKPSETAFEGRCTPVRFPFDSIPGGPYT